MTCPMCHTRATDRVLKQGRQRVPLACSTCRKQITETK